MFRQRLRFSFYSLIRYLLLLSLFYSLFHLLPRCIAGSLFVSVIRYTYFRAAIFWFSFWLLLSDRFGLGPALLFGAKEKIFEGEKERFSIDIGNRKISGSYWYMGLETLNLLLASSSACCSILWTFVLILVIKFLLHLLGLKLPYPITIAIYIPASIETSLRFSCFDNSVTLYQFSIATLDPA